MWTELPSNKTQHRGPKPQRSVESEMPTFTTDVRMEKVGELFGSSAGHAEKEEQVQGSGGGGTAGGGMVGEGDDDAVED